MRTKFLSRKDEIVLTTINLIHEFGVSNVSMKDISKREGVTDASLYKHFHNKEALLDAVLEYYEQYDTYIRTTLKAENSTIVEKLYKYFSIYSEYYSNYKEITSIMFSYDVFIHDKHFCEGESNRRFDEVNFLTELIKEGQEKGILKVNFEAENLGYVLLGSFERTIQMWRLHQYNFNLQEKVNKIIGCALDAYLSSKDESKTIATD